MAFNLIINFCFVEVFFIKNLGLVMRLDQW